jgi:hypothetical protein
MPDSTALPLTLPSLTSDHRQHLTLGAPSAQFVRGGCHHPRSPFQAWTALYARLLAHLPGSCLARPL